MRLSPALLAALVALALPAAAAELSCPVLFESGDARLVGDLGTEAATLTASPQDHAASPGALRFFTADDGMGSPSVLRVTKPRTPAITVGFDPAPAFADVAVAAETCPFDATWCATYWPSAADGSVVKVTVREARGACAWRRTFHVYRPVRAGAGPVPLVVVLHGGFGSGLQQLQQGWDELADGRAIPWRPNTSTCRYTYPAGYADPVSGAACLPPPVIVRGTQPFVVVYPDGLEDEGAAPAPDAARHWEDGRVPSPGQSGTGPVCDDVGFIDHVLAAVQAQWPGLIDAERMSLAGTSNGGMMAQRIACAALAGSHAELSRLAAVVVVVAALPAPLADGSDGRETCPVAGTRELPVQFIIGRGFDTPDCSSYPCVSPVVDGDGNMPFGVAGGRHHVFSPELGLVLSGPDSFERWVAYAESAAGATAARSTLPMGYYTQGETATFGASVARVERLLTDGGAHAVAGTRLDVHPWARAWEFLAGFRRLPDGSLQAVPGSALSGTW